MTTATPETNQITNNVAEFDHGHLEIENATAQFDMPMVSPEAFLVVRPATSENKHYNAASLRMSGKRQRNIATSGSLTSADADQDRKDDRILYPKYVIIGWGGVFNKQNELVKFNFENCRAFVAKLPAWILDRLRIFCMRPERFLPEDDLDEQQEPDPVQVAGN